MSKRLLLTGAGGFVGSHTLAHVLQETDWDVVVVDSFRHKGKTDRITQTFAGGPPEWRDRVHIYVHDLAAPFSAQAVHRLGRLDYIIAMASESHVDRSIAEPLPFVRNNVELIMNTLELARTVQPEHMIVISTDEVYGPLANGDTPHREWAPIVPSNPYAASKAAQEALSVAWWRTYSVPLSIVNCFDMQTRVMTADGFKTHAGLTLGEKVWALDAEGNMRLEPVLGLMRKRGPAQMMRIAAKGVSQLVTPEHRMMIQRGAGSPRRYLPIEEVPAGELLGMKGRARIPRCGEWQGDDDPVFRPYEHFTPKPNRSGKRLPQEMPAEQMAALFGWYISEGHVARGTVRIGAASTAQQDAAFAAFGGIEGTPYRNDCQRGSNVCLANSHLGDLLLTAGHLSRNKHVPAFVRTLAPKYLQVFFDAMIDGDGVRKPNGGVYYTVSERLAQDMCEVGMKLGYATRISVRETWNPAKTLKSPSFIVSFSPPKHEIEARNVSEVDYDGDVWCLSVPSGRVFIERDGIVSLSGQCMNLIGEMQDPEKFLPMLIAKIRAGEDVTIHGSPGNIGSRHYLHARNLADALLFILRNLPPSAFPAFPRPDRYNIVGPDRVTNLQLASSVAKLLGEPLRYKLEDFHSTRPGHDPHYGLSGGKLRVLGWKMPVAFDASLAKTVHWSLAHPEWLLPE